MDFECANNITKYQPRMRKTLTILMTLFCVMAMGQDAVKVVAKFKKGDYVVYDIKQTTTQVSDANDTHEFVIAGETRYDVIDADKTGYTISCKAQKWESQNSPENDLASNLVKSAMTMLVGQAIIMRANLDGKIIKIENMDELRQKMEDYMDGLLDKLFSGEGMNNQDIISKEKMRKIMLGVASPAGTARRAAIRGYSVAGKTGTAQKVINGHYSDSLFRATFCGMVPASDPKLVILVTLDFDEKRKFHQGGNSSGPVFRRIATGLLRYLMIPPDKPEELSDFDDDDEYDRIMEDRAQKIGNAAQ